ncbi:hypothetical protein GF337_09135 [candidate division KSB1 bacterium]|nr:hypothetical protein [candidate division KSB1 bacterium]
MKFKISVFFLLGVIFFISCAHRTNERIDVSRRAPSPVYRIGAGDVLEVKFFDNDRFSRQVIVRPDGRITLEKIGDIYVDGYSPQEIDSMITLEYQDILKSPDVTIFVHQFANQKVYVMGEIQKPGGYAIEQGMTAAQAIAVAGGFKRTASRGSVLLIRKSEDGIVSARRLNMKAFFAARPKQQDQSLIARDIIYVPRTFIANLDAFLNQFFDLILPPLDIYWRLWFMEQVYDN